MTYQNELDFLLSLLKNYHIPVRIYSIYEEITSFDFQLREKINFSEDYTVIRNFIINDLQPVCIYKVTDEFFCNYYILQLPEFEEPSILLIGPYIRQMPTRQIFENMEKNNILPQLFKIIQNFVYTLTVINDDSFLQIILKTFGEKIWGNRVSFVIKELSNSMQEIFQNMDWPTKFSELGEKIFDFQAIETYSARENELLRIVSQGQTEKADAVLSSLIPNHLGQLSINYLSYLKLQMVSLNTLLRKAGEVNEVDIKHLARLSSMYIQKLEEAATPDSCIALMHEMVHKYCLAIHNYSLKEYSKLIQDVMKLTDSDPAEDLSLRNLAKQLNVNPSYLSNLFRKETGKTLTEYVNQKRIQHAIFLLNTTTLQIQTIAQYCGINDVNYFIKLFKKYVHKSPTSYRKEIHKHINETY